MVGVPPSFGHKAAPVSPSRPFLPLPGPAAIGVAVIPTSRLRPAVPAVAALSVFVAIAFDTVVACPSVVALAAEDVVVP